MFDIEGNRFLRHMVRVIVGTLIDVGRGRLAPPDVAALLEPCADRGQGGQTAPAAGLCLQSVFYDSADGGPSKAG